MIYGVLKSLYEEYFSFYYTLFLNEKEFLPIFIEKEKFKLLNLNVLEEANLICSTRSEKSINGVKNKYHEVQGLYQVYPIKFERNEPVFVITDWDEFPRKNKVLYINGSTENIEKFISSDSEWVFPTFKFKEQFVYHFLWTISSLEDYIRKNNLKKIDILDFGTGAGSYSLLLGHYFKIKRPEIKINLVGTEISKRAICFAKKNSILNDINLEIVEGDILICPQILNGRKFDVVIANPPYVPTPPEFEYLKWGWAGEDGLRFTLGLVEKAPYLLKENGKMILVAYSLGNKHFPFDFFEKISNLQGLRTIASHIYPPVWVGFNPEWRENPLPLFGLTLRFEREVFEKEGFRMEHERGFFIENWLLRMKREKRTYLHHLLLEVVNSDKPEFFFVRKPLLPDFTKISDIERNNWPPGMQMELDRIIERFEICPEGFWVIYQYNHEWKLRGFATSQRIFYIPEKGRNGKSWDYLTARGKIRDTSLQHGNALHFVSATVDKGVRRKGLWGHLLKMRILTAFFSGMKYVLITSRLPGASGEKEDVLPFTKNHGFTKFLERMGFELRGVAKGDLADPESDDWCAFMVKRLEEFRI